MTISNEDSLKSMWQEQPGSPPRAPEDLMAMAAWLEAGCPQDDHIDALLAGDRSLRHAISDIRLKSPESSDHTISETSRSELLASVLDALSDQPNSRHQRNVIGSIGFRLAAMAAAVAVAAIGFSFGRTAAPATNQAAGDFVTVVTFDMLVDDEPLNLILTTSALTNTNMGMDPAPEGDLP